MRNISLIFKKKMQKWIKRCCLKIFLIYSSDSTFVWHSRIICAILVEGIMRNISVKLLKDLGQSYRN